MIDDTYTSTSYRKHANSTSPDCTSEIHVKYQCFLDRHATNPPRGWLANSFQAEFMDAQSIA